MSQPERYRWSHHVNRDGLSPQFAGLALVISAVALLTAVAAIWFALN